MTAEVISIHEARQLRDVGPEGFEDVPAVMSPGQLAVVLDVSVRTLNRWREIGEGPAFQHPKGSKVYRYYRRDLIAWLENKKPGAATPGQNKD